MKNTLVVLSVVALVLAAFNVSIGANVSLLPLGLACFVASGLTK